jgi:hypothetical protein
LGLCDCLHRRWRCETERAEAGEATAMVP